MSGLLFFIFNYKGYTKPYYRNNDKIYNHLNEEIKSEDIKARIFDSKDVKYYQLSDINDNIESLPIVVNLIYDNNENFHSTYAILSTTESYLLKVLPLEELLYPLKDYTPYELITLCPFPSLSKLSPFNVVLFKELGGDIKNKISEHAYNTNLTLIYIPISPKFEPTIDFNTGLPKYILIHNLRVGFIGLQQFKKMQQQHQIYQCIIDNEIQKWTKTPNTIITVFGFNGITYLLNAYYDKEKNMIHPPKFMREGTSD